MTADVRIPAEADREQIARVLSTSLHFPLEAALTRSKTFPLDDIRCAYVDDRVVATAAEFPFTQWFGGNGLACSGVWGVATEPERRGAGLASACLGSADGRRAAARDPGHRALPGRDRTVPTARLRAGRHVRRVSGGARRVAGGRHARPSDRRARRGRTRSGRDHGVLRALARSSQRHDRARRDVLAHAVARTSVGRMASCRRRTRRRHDHRLRHLHARERLVGPSLVRLRPEVLDVRRRGRPRPPRVDRLRTRVPRPRTVARMVGAAQRPDDDARRCAGGRGRTTATGGCSASSTCAPRWKVAAIPRSTRRRRSRSRILDTKRTPASGACNSQRASRRSSRRRRTTGDRSRSARSPRCSPGTCDPDDAVRLGYLDRDDPAVEALDAMLSGPDPWCPFFF